MPTVTADGRRAPALRFGDPRVMALLGALCAALNTLGFTHRSLRARVSQTARRVLHHQPDELRPRPAAAQRPDRTLPDTNTYDLTADGHRVAVFYTKVHNRLLRPLLAADPPPAPPELRDALATINRHVTTYIDHARLPKAA